MFKLLAWAHAALLRLCLRLLAMPFRAIWAVILLVLAMLGEEVRRWAGIIVSGLLILGAGKAILTFAPDQAKQPLVMAVLVLVCIWALAVRRAAWYTSHNNLRGVRQRQAFRGLASDVGNIQARLRAGILTRAASTARGTPVEGAFRSNRDALAQERAEQAAAAERAEARRAEAAAEEQRREDLADLEPDPYTWEMTP